VCVCSSCVRFSFLSTTMLSDWLGRKRWLPNCCAAVSNMAMYTCVVAYFILALQYVVCMKLFCMYRICGDEDWHWWLWSFRWVRRSINLSSVVNINKTYHFSLSTGYYCSISAVNRLERIDFEWYILCWGGLTSSVSYCLKTTWQYYDAVDVHFTHFAA